MAGFLGMRGTGDWAADQRPKSWREGILRLYPNGSAPLTAILSMMNSEKVTDPEYYWWTKSLPTQRGTITGIYTDALSTPYTSGGSQGDTLYVKMAEADADQCRAGHQVLLRDASDITTDVNAKVSAVTKNGANSYLTVSLLEDDDNSGYGHDLSDADTFLIIGNINEEGAAMPSAITYNPTKVYNYTQIFRTPLSITRTARLTSLRTGDAYKEIKREALELHSLEMEKAFLFGYMYENTGTGGKPERTTEGVVTTVRRLASANVSDFSLDTNYSGKEWLEDGGGEEWFESYLELVFRVGDGEKLGLCGSGALLGINRLARQGAHYQMTSKTMAYGIKVIEWVTPFGVIYLKTHPLFSNEATLRNSMVILEPRKIRSRYITDTTFYSEKKGAAAEGTNRGRYDSTDEEYLTEIGLELHHPSCFGFLNGIGQDNAG